MDDVVSRETAAEYDLGAVVTTRGSPCSEALPPLPCSVVKTGG
jgi:hypothetical protein